MDNNFLNFFLTTLPLQKWPSIDQSPSAYVTPALYFLQFPSIRVTFWPSPYDAALQLFRVHLVFPACFHQAVVPPPISLHMHNKMQLSISEWPL